MNQKKPREGNDLGKVIAIFNQKGVGKLLPVNVSHIRTRI